MNAPDSEDNESYTVIHETVKKRPVRWRRVLTTAAGVLAAAVLFGIVAAFVFSRFINVFGVGQEDPVSFAPDPTPTVTPDPTQTPTPTPSPTPTEEPEEEPEPTQEPTPAPDPAAESEERIRQNRLLYSDLRRISAEPSRAVVTVTGITASEDWFMTGEERSETSGVIVAEHGGNYYILADYSSLEDSERILVTLYDGTITESTLVKMDPATGLAIVSVPMKEIDETVRAGIQVAVLGNSYNAGVGEPVIALGAPAGFSGAVVFGQITSTDRRISVTDAAYPLIMTNIQGASSGSGVLINLDGEVIGLIEQKYAASFGGTMICALSVSPLKRVMEILSNNGEFAYLGIVGEDVTTEAAESFDMPVGIYITEVEMDSPAFNAGLQRGDIITQVGDTVIGGMSGLTVLKTDGMAGSEQEIRVRRLGADGYAELTFNITLGNR